MSCLRYKEAPRHSDLRNPLAMPHGTWVMVLAPEPKGPGAGHVKVLSWYE